VFLGVLNNISALYAENNLTNTSNSLSAVLRQLSSGSRINSGADDAAGLSFVNGLEANAQALAQSQTNVGEGVGLLRVADGALSQVTNLLNRAVTLATEASNGTLTSTQDRAADQEYQSILSEITNIGATTTFNQRAVFGSDTRTYTGDSSSSGAFVDDLNIRALAASSVGDTNGVIAYNVTTAGGASPTTLSTLSYTDNAGQDLSATNLRNPGNAETALTALNAAISCVSAQDGYIGAQINTLNAVDAVLGTQLENVTAAQNAIEATDYASATSNMAKYEILMQTGISALAQANSMQQEITKLLE